MERRNFIKLGTAYAVSFSFLGISASCEGSGVGGTDCETTADILGPYYRADSPIRTDLRIPGDEGAPIIVQGRVYSGSDCTNPIEGAIVEVWHCDDAGAYDNTSNDFKYRGQYETGTAGFYFFQTILPGRYLNGATFRPSHIHFRITAPEHNELVSQIYFKDDPYIESDPWASSETAELRVLEMQTGEEGVNYVTFDIYLAAT